DRGAARRGDDRGPRASVAGVERDGVVRRLRAADGPRLRASRSHVAGDSRGTLDRLPSAGAPGGAREARPDVRPHVAGARGGRAWSNLGGGRVMDRALMAHRSGWFARDSKIVGSARATWGHGVHLRVYRL